MPVDAEDTTGIKHLNFVDEKTKYGSYVFNFPWGSTTSTGVKKSGDHKAAYSTTITKADIQLEKKGHDKLPKNIALDPRKVEARKKRIKKKKS